MQLVSNHSLKPLPGRGGVLSMNGTVSYKLVKAFMEGK